MTRTAKSIYEAARIASRKARPATPTATETTERNRKMIVELATRLLADPRIARSAAGASWTDAADLRHTLEALGEAAGFLGIATDEELAAFGIER